MLLLVLLLRFPHDFIRYPLFLDRLVSETDPKHPDHRDLTKANTKMADVAKEINEYTKRLDLGMVLLYFSSFSICSLIFSLCLPVRNMIFLYNYIFLYNFSGQSTSTGLRVTSPSRAKCSASPSTQLSRSPPGSPPRCLKCWASCHR